MEFEGCSPTSAFCRSDQHRSLEENTLREDLTVQPSMIHILSVETVNFEVVELTKAEVKE